MKANELKEQMQEDLISILESFGIEECMNGKDWEAIKTLLCDRVIYYINETQNQ